MIHLQTSKKKLSKQSQLDKKMDQVFNK